MALDARAYGARMTGGGFGGCVIALVDADNATEQRQGHATRTARGSATPSIHGR